MTGGVIAVDTVCAALMGAAEIKRQDEELGADIHYTVYLMQIVVFLGK